MQILIELRLFCNLLHEPRDLDKESTFPCGRAISEAMRQNWTRRLRTDCRVHSLNSGKVAATPILRCIICPIAIFAFYSLNYSLAARLQNNSRPKSPTKVETKRKLQQFTVSGWLIMNGGESGNEKRKV